MDDNHKSDRSHLLIHNLSRYMDLVLCHVYILSQVEIFFWRVNHEFMIIRTYHEVIRDSVEIVLR